MELSTFILPIRISSGYLLFNTANQSLIELDEDSWPYFQNLIENGSPVDNQAFNLDILSDQEFVVEKKDQQLSLIRMKFSKNRFDSRHAKVVLIPTLACNYECEFCYRGRSVETKMSQEVVSGIKRIVDQLCSEVDFLTFIWHGGEPILAWDLIEELSEYTRGIAEGKKVNFSARLLTNGSLLTIDKIKKFENLDIKRVQISFDGPRYNYNKSHKNIANGKPFELVIENISRILNLSSRTFITLKFNVHKQNSSSIHDFLEDILIFKQFNNIRIVFGHVLNYSCGCNLGIEKCLSTSEFAEWYWQIVPKLRSFGWGVTPSLPKLDATICEADHYYSFCIDPRGNIYRCDAEINEDASYTSCLLEKPFDIGNVRSSALFSRYLDYYPMEDNFCNTCNLLPICGGGCPYLRIKNKRDRSFCEGVKRFIELQVIDYWKNRKV